MPKDVWGELVEDYDEWHRFMAGPDLVEAVEAAVKEAVPHGNVVELGCGTGIYTHEYADRCAHVLALDASGPMVERASAKLADRRNVEVREGDAYATGLPDASVDGVVAVNLLHIVSDAEGVVTEMRRIVRPGGSVVIADATVSGMSVGRILKSIWRTVRSPALKTSQRGQRNISQSALEELVRDVGFAPVEGHLIDGEVMNASFVRAYAPAAGFAG